MSAETALLPVARPRPKWLPGIGLLALVLAVLIGVVALAATRSGGGHELAGDPAVPLGAGSPGSPAGGPSGSPSGGPAVSPAVSAAASPVASSGPPATPSAARPSSPVTRPPAASSAAPTPAGRSPSPAGAGGAALTVAFRQSDRWNDGYQATFTITNRGRSPVSGWTVTVTFSGPGDIQWWDADGKAGTSHQMIFTAKPYNSTVPAGGSVTFGLVVRGSPAPTPTACAVNGRPC